MTTIATDGRTVAADSLITNGRSCVELYNQPKIYHEADRVFAASGDIYMVEPMIRWYLKSPKCPDVKAFPTHRTEDSCQIWIFEDGQLYEITSNFPHKLQIQAPTAMGSGHHYARGAMVLGHSPAEAVWAASVWDPGTGGDIVSFELPERLRVNCVPIPSQGPRKSNRQAGGLARMASMTELERSEFALKGARKRWKKENPPWSSSI